MSVEFYLVCHKHKERLWVCSDGLSGPLTQLSDNRTLAAFIITHRNCELSVIDENNEGYEDYIKWDESDYKDLLRYDAY